MPQGGILNHCIPCCAMGDGQDLRDREGILVLLGPGSLAAQHPEPACLSHARVCHLSLWGGTDVLPVWPLPAPVPGL